MGWIFRNFKSRDQNIMKTLWKSLLQPHIDYCSTLWFDPNNLGQVKVIENLQRQFTRKLSGMSDLNYWDRLKTLKLYSQERRLERYRILYTWKCIENLIPNCGLTTHFSVRWGRYVNLKPLNSKSTHRFKSIREGSFSTNGPRLFNSLPAALRGLSNCTVDHFKQQLDSYLCTVPDKPSCDSLKPGAINLVTGRHSNSLIDQIRLMSHLQSGY